MTEILLVIVIVLLIINIFISTRKEEVNMGKISENIENKEKYKSFLDNFDKLSNSGLLHIEELNEIKNKLKIYGEINYKKSFPFEKF